ncbi:LacI family DNA-binding transcriptional regulator [Devosia pacifica]|uniref:LacI family DNA-binding transcriptional regulator n=1 Tax=Devosia pacifica TaxID=1335967 RepID=UPI001677EE85|nr:LacI family DNA-binding transcriptional regulator [Devosia pacifica]
MDEPNSDAALKPRAKVGLKEIAREAEVSISTVSHVMNGTARISDEVRARVMRVAQELGYLGMRRQRANTGTLSKLLLAVPAYGLAQTEANLFLWNILSAFRTRCAELNIALVPHSPPGENLTAEGIVQAAASNACDAVMLMHDDRPELLEPLAAVRNQLPPTVLVNGEDPNMNLDTVSPQNRFAAGRAVRWLTELGHRRVLHVTWGGRTTIARRRDGFHDAMAQVGIPAHEASVLSFQTWDLALAEQVLSEKLVEIVRREKITAIFCAADNVALHALNVLRRAGIRVPEDVSLVGFDNVMHAEMSSPPLSTVEVPVNHIGSVALRLLEERLIEPFDPTAPTRRVELECRLIKRASVAAPAS